jgi:hypothetical protein
MILKTFHSSQTLILLLLPFIMGVFWVSGFLEPNLTYIDHTSVLFQSVEPNNPYLNKTLAFVLILITGIQLNSVINRTDFFDKNTYLTSLLYVVFMSGVPQFQQMHPIVVSNLFWVLAFRRLLNIYGQVACKSEIFDASLFILIGALFNYPSGFFLILLPIITLIIFRPFILKEYGMPLLAFFLVAVYVYVFQFIIGVQVLNLEEMFSFSSDSSIRVKMNWTHYIMYGFMFIAFVFSVYQIRQRLSRSSVRFRKLIQSIWAFIILVIGVILLEHWYFTNDSVVLFLAVPLCVFYTFYFYHTAHRWLASTLFYGVFLLKIVNIYLL